MKRLLLFILALPIMLSAQVSKRTAFVDNIYPCVVYEPSYKDPNKYYPTFFFWHGAGEAVDNYSTAALSNLANSGNQANLLKAAEQYGFIVVAPLLIKSLNGWNPGWKNDYQARYIKWALGNINIDTSRVYATGLSLGGGGTFVAITGPYSKLFAAGIAICSTPQYECDFSQVAKNSVALWAWHGELDAGVTSWKGTQNMVNLINNYNPPIAPKFTLIPNVGHSIWGQVYGNQDIYTWALSYKKGVTPEPEPPTPPVKVIIARLFVAGLEVIVYSDKTAEVKQ